ncbi:hypothetical protein GF337_11560 [candidate division KSB1 bacterium]|nr:hypothetical protein [candidate division KSB1 bacterium]
MLQINAHREIIIEYENRIYRNELTALSIVLKYSSQILVAFDKFYIVPKQRNIPLMTISARAAHIRQFLNHEMSEAEFAEVITIDHGTLKKMDNFFYRTSPRQNSFFRSDFVIHPGFKAQFSRPNDPAQLQLSLQPTIRTPITTGLQLEAQMNFPFYNEFDTTSYSPTFSKIICNYIFRPAVHHFVSLSIGNFDLGYQGISMEYVRYFLNGQLALSSKIDYTTTSQSWNTDFEAHYLLSTKYRFPRVDFSIEAAAGHFLFEDDTWRIAVVRSFGELDLGFMGIWSDTIGILTGMIVNIPFPVSRHKPPSAFRIIAPNSIPWKYRYLPLDDGYILDTGTEIDSFMKRLFPSYILNNIHLLRN